MMNLKLRFVPGVAVAVLSNVGLANAQQIRVVVDGERVHFGGQPPIEVNDRVLVPLRGVFEELGAEVNWNPSNQTVTAQRGDTRVRLKIGQRSANVNGERVNLDVPAQVIDGSTMVPLRFVGEALGERVHWDSETQTVSIFEDEEYSFNRDRDESNGRRRRDDEDQGYVDKEPPRPRNYADSEPDLPPPIIFDVDTVLPTRLNINLRRWHPGDRVTTVIPAYPGLPPGCEVSGIVGQAGPAYYGQPPTIDLHFDTLVTPDGRRYHIDGRGVPFKARTNFRAGNGYWTDDRAPRPLISPYDRGRVGIRLNRPLRIEGDPGGHPPRDRDRDPDFDGSRL